MKPSNCMRLEEAIFCASSTAGLTALDALPRHARVDGH
jgi:hypothetical protein